MKRIFLSFILCFLLIWAVVNCFALDNGLYVGTLKMCVENPIQCSEIDPGHARIINLGGNQIIYQNILIWMGNEIILEQKNCKINGKAIICEPMGQYLDLSIYGFDAIILNNTSRGAGIITDDGFTINYSVRINNCYGSDCDVVGEWMYGEEISFPCYIGPWISEFVFVGE